MFNEKITTHFSYKECTFSATAQRLGIDNNPNKEQLECIENVCKKILEPVRTQFNKPVIITSFYRSSKLCEAIGSSKNSQHTKGQAVDFEIIGISNLDVAKFIKDKLDFDQLILEYFNSEDLNSGWIHCSYNNQSNNRKQVLRTSKVNGKLNYLPGLL